LPMAPTPPATDTFATDSFATDSFAPDTFATETSVTGTSVTGTSVTGTSVTGTSATPATDALAFDEFEFELPDEPLPDEPVPPGASVAEQDSFEAPAAFGEPVVFDEPVSEGEIPELDMEITFDDAAIPELPNVEALAAPDSDLLGGDRGIDFRLEEDDLEGLDEAELALEMDGAPPAEDDFEFGDEGDSANTKLDLARAYSEMGDPDGAREILLEVLKEGTAAQQQAAQELLDRL
jgi:pilus assembly protein FimV